MNKGGSLLWGRPLFARSCCVVSLLFYLLRDTWKGTSVGTSCLLERGDAWRSLKHHLRELSCQKIVRYEIWVCSLHGLKDTWVIELGRFTLKSGETCLSARTIARQGSNRVHFLKGKITVSLYHLWYDRVILEQKRIWLHVLRCIKLGVI